MRGEENMTAYDRIPDEGNYWSNMRYWYSRMRTEQREDLVIQHYNDIEKVQMWYGDLALDYPLAAHQQFEFIYHVGAEPVEYTIGTKRYHFEKGDVILLDSYMPHNLLLPGGYRPAYRRYGLMIDRAFFAEIVREYPDLRCADFLRQPVVHLDRDSWQAIITLFETACGEFRDNALHWRLSFASIALRIFCLTVRAVLDGRARGIPQEKDELIDRIIAYIEDHYTTGVSLEDAARCLFVSESTVSHTIKKKLGVSFYAYTTQRRMLAARTLISQGVPAGEASARVGFSDYTSFLRLFKKAYGVTPSQMKGSAR